MLKIELGLRVTLQPGIDGYDRAGFVSDERLHELVPVYHGIAVR
jgi:hypothetical protein